LVLTNELQIIVKDEAVLSFGAMSADSEAAASQTFDFGNKQLQKEYSRLEETLFLFEKNLVLQGAADPSNRILQPVPRLLTQISATKLWARQTSKLPSKQCYQNEEILVRFKVKNPLCLALELDSMRVSCSFRSDGS